MATFSEIKDVLDAISEVIKKEPFWNQKDENQFIQNAKEEILDTILKKRIPQYNNIKNLKNDQSHTLKIQKADMNDISHALFLGNDAVCCTAVGGINDDTAPEYIQNKCISAIEIKNNEEFIGNTMCYFAKVNGELSLILDQIGLNPKYQYIDEITDGLIEYAKKLCEEVGKPEIPIYTSTKRNKVDLVKFPIEKKQIEILGNTDKQEVYIDFVTTKMRLPLSEPISAEVYLLNPTTKNQ